MNGNTWDYGKNSLSEIGHLLPTATISVMSEALQSFSDVCNETRITMLYVMINTH